LRGGEGGKLNSRPAKEGGRRLNECGMTKKKGEAKKGTQLAAVPRRRKTTVFQYCGKGKRGTVTEDRGRRYLSVIGKRERRERERDDGAFSNGTEEREGERTVPKWGFYRPIRYPAS